MALVWPIVSLALLLSLHQTKSEKCGDLKGFWYNQLGSEMMLSHGEEGKLFGEYRTAVERKKGTAGTGYSIVTGAAPFNKPGTTFGFTVSWRGGKSTTVWTAQCIVCDDEEVITTTWLLRSLVDTCTDKWKSTYIGQDYFTRKEQAVGPRKRFGTHTPQGYEPTENSGRKRRSIFEMHLNTPLRIRRQSGAESREPCALDGTWYNLIGSKLELKELPDHTLQGSYQTARERYAGKPSHHSSVYGVGNYEIVDHTFAMLVVWKDASTTGWVGQCHICSDSNNRTTELLEMAWLHRSQVGSCAANWKSTLYGQNSFYREVSEPDTRVGLDVIGEFGEEVDVTSSAGKIEQLSRPLLLIFFTTIICQSWA